MDSATNGRRSGAAVFRPAHKYPVEYRKASPQMELLCGCHPGLVTGRAVKTGITPPLHPLGERACYRLTGTFGPHRSEDHGLHYFDAGAFVSARLDVSAVA